MRKRSESANSTTFFVHNSTYSMVWYMQWKDLQYSLWDMHRLVCGFLQYILLMEHTLRDKDQHISSSMANSDLK